MKIEESTVKKLSLTELDRLDPVTVILEDFKPGHGKIIIECYGEAWASYWGAMGDRGIAEFVRSCDVHYLAKNLSKLPATVMDIDKINKAAEAAGLEEMEEGNLNRKTLAAIYGDEWWYGAPEEPNHKYEYLCRIITAVKTALVGMT